MSKKIRLAVLEWNDAQKEQPEIGQYVAELRFRYPSYYFIGFVYRKFKEREDEDVPDLWMELPIPNIEVRKKFPESTLWMTDGKA